MKITHTTHSRIICFGEILFDIVAGKELPGGAPMNVAYNLHRLGIGSSVITRVGEERHGEELKRLLSSAGIDTTLLQTDQQYPTGIVHATVGDNHEMNYEIVAPAAWDYIVSTDEAIESVATADYFVFGSLSARNEVSRATLFSFLQHAKKKVLDINLRAPFYNQPLVETLMQQADILKMNEAELGLITDWMGSFETIIERAKFLQQRFQLPIMIVTMGGDGAYVFDDENVFHHKGYKVTVADTIGSGDAFLAGFLSQIVNGSSTEEALSFASALGAFIASQHGAWANYTEEDILRLMNSGDE